MKIYKNFLLTGIFLILVTLNLQAGIGQGESANGPLPVELVSFTANASSDVVVLNWTTATEVNNYGFDIQKMLSGAEAWETIGFVAGHGNSNSPNDYSFVDATIASSNAQYRLKQLDTDGSFEYSSVIEVSTTLLKEFMLEQNYPNPFNPTTVISYSIPTASYVSVKVYDVLGNLITTLVNTNQEASNYSVSFNANNLSNGVYFYKINAGNFTDIKKMLLIK